VAPVGASHLLTTIVVAGARHVERASSRPDQEHPDARRPRGARRCLGARPSPTELRVELRRARDEREARASLARAQAQVDRATLAATLARLDFHGGAPGWYRGLEFATPGRGGPCRAVVARERRAAGRGRCAGRRPRRGRCDERQAHGVGSEAHRSCRRTARGPGCARQLRSPTSSGRGWSKVVTAAPRPPGRRGSRARARPSSRRLASRRASGPRARRRAPARTCRGRSTGRRRR
jgi:hypothetical protein